MMLRILFKTAPGLEYLLLKEWQLKSIGLESENKLLPGGVEINADLKTCLFALRYLKSSSNFSIRLQEWKCRDLPQLFKKIKEMPWNKITGAAQINFYATCKKSRLMHTKKIEQSAQEAFEEYRRMNPAPQAEHLSFQCHLHFENDLCTVNLTQMGDHFYKRSQKKTGEAPLRENIAAAFFVAALPYLNDQYSFLDPFAGSGTFILEFAHFAQENTLYWQLCKLPLFKGHLAPQLKSEFPQAQSMSANDFDPQHVKLLQHNLKSMAHITQHDSYQFPFAPVDFICTNPPYGMRVKVERQQLMQALERFKAQLLGVVLPLSFPKLKTKKVLEEIQFNHGGKKVCFRLYAEKT